MKALVLRWMRLPADLPTPPAGSHRSVEIVRASPRWLAYRRVLVTLAFVVPVAALLVGVVAAFVGGGPIGGFAMMLTLPLALAIYVMTLFCLRIEYDLRTYMITDRSLRVRQGAWILEEMTLTWANVQNVTISQGPLQRVFGIFDLRVDTAGGGGAKGSHGETNSAHSVILRGLEDPKTLREHLLVFVRAHQKGHSGLGDPDEARVRGAAVARAEILTALSAVRASAATLRECASRVGSAARRGG